MLVELFSSRGDRGGLLGDGQTVSSGAGFIRESG